MGNERKGGLFMINIIDDVILSCVVGIFVVVF